MAHTSSSDRPPRRYRFAYHYREWALVGSSGSGKTTLACKLLTHLSAKGYRLGYAKHDAHGFSMDVEGKDTYKARQAGAQVVSIVAGGEYALLGALGQGPGVNFLHLDAVMAEGHSQTKLAKLLVLDATGEGLQKLRDGVIEGVFALVGPMNLKPSEEELSTLGLPWFDRDDVESIGKLLETRFLTSKPRVKGLVLAGGYSVRMGSDKAALNYEGSPQIDRAFALLEAHCEQVYASVRHDQTEAAWARGKALIKDSILGIGPLSGVISALQSDPEAAWLVIAVDQPLLDEATLGYLLDARRHLSLGTAYRSPHDGRPEPLCSIYEPHSYPVLLAQVGMDKLCPRTVFELPGVVLLYPSDPSRLANVNTPDEAANAKAVLAGGRV